jgi:hypothetical protein
MDFYMPYAKIALFMGGTIWHANPSVYKAEDVLFFSRKISSTAQDSNISSVCVAGANFCAILLFID